MKLRLIATILLASGLTFAQSAAAADRPGSTVPTPTPTPIPAATASLAQLGTSFYSIFAEDAALAGGYERHYGTGCTGGVYWLSYSTQLELLNGDATSIAASLFANDRFSAAAANAIARNYFI